MTSEINCIAFKRPNRDKNRTEYMDLNIYVETTFQKRNSLRSVIVRFDRRSIFNLSMENDIIKNNVDSRTKEGTN